MEKQFLRLENRGLNLTSTINSFKAILEQKHFMRNNGDKYSSLTPREKETFSNSLLKDTLMSRYLIKYTFHLPHQSELIEIEFGKNLDITQLSDCSKDKCLSNYQLSFLSLLSYFLTYALKRISRV